MAVTVRSGVDERSESMKLHGYRPVNGPVGTQLSRAARTSHDSAPRYSDGSGLSGRAAGSV